MNIPMDQLLSLPVSEKLAIVEALWDDISKSGERPVLSPEQRIEIERRSKELEADPSLAITREEMWRRVGRSDG